MQGLSRLPYNSPEISEGTGLSAAAAAVGKTDLRRIGAFLSLVLASVGVTYFAPEFFGFVFYVATLVVYYRSKSEAFWLAYFTVLSDGFFGFFGMYSAMITLIPGLPAVEVGQLYILLSVAKAYKKPVEFRPFYQTPLLVLGIYVLFLLVQGYVLGVSMELNVQFRLFKWIVPLLLLYSIPRLFERLEHYRDIFLFLFPVAFAAFFAQVVTIVTAHTPMQILGVQGKVWYAVEVTSKKIYRGSYSDNIMIITYFGALFFLACKKRYFSNGYLFAVIAANFASVFLSATRGWVLCFSLTAIAAAVFVLDFNLRRFLTIGMIGIAFLFFARFVPVIGVQIDNAYKRMLSLEKLAGGDLTAGGTLVRLNERGPRVMKKWRDSPLTGWGFSTGFMESNDFHVGNQNILMHSGIVGALLMGLFFLNFIGKLFLKSVSLPPEAAMKGVMLIVVIYFFGWFLLHSTSLQLFSYYQIPACGAIQAIFFSMGAWAYANPDQINELNT
jgi:hypothetical protein